MIIFAFVKREIWKLGAYVKYPHVVSMINLKGGVGKTTLCVNLAYGLAFFHNFRVLIVDLDPQANATQYLISQQTYRNIYLGSSATKKTIVEVYQESRDSDLTLKRRPLADPGQYIQRVYTGKDGSLDLLASKLELSLIGFLEGHGHQNDQVRWFIEQVGANYDYVLIDCPPTVSRMLMAAFEASQSFIVPVKPEFLSTIGIPLLDQVLKNLYQQKIARRAPYLPPSLKPIGIIYTMVNEQLNMTKESMTDLNLAAAKLGYPVFSNTISSSTKYTWSSRQSLPVFRSEPRSKYAAEISSVVEEFILKAKV
ncbi:ParA family protein [Xanthomonas arboricola]|uniref:ParA family protein n=1 Tax=Xanthomonas arboricola TaxID=56448 RepID=UPI0011B0E549|nr:ParA family protein [Xanthomonas arboricola]